MGFEVAAQGTSLEGAELEIEEVPPAGVCPLCGETALTELPLSCAGCGALDVQVTRGHEVMVESLELEGTPGGATAGSTTRRRASR